MKHSFNLALTINLFSICCLVSIRSFAQGSPDSLWADTANSGTSEYLIIRGVKLNYRDAVELSTSLGYKLAVIDNEEENEFLMKTAFAKEGVEAPDGNQYWIGAIDIEEEGQWVWASTGQQFYDQKEMKPVAGLYQNWGSTGKGTQPNNFFKNDEDEDCVVIRNNGLWYDIGCTKRIAYFIGERPKVPKLDWEIEILYDKGGFTEGCALAKDGSIYFSEMDQSAIMCYDPSSKSLKTWTQKSNTSNGLFIRDNFLYTCETAGRCISRYDLNKGPDSRVVLVDNYQGKRIGCPNDLSLINDRLYFSELWNKRRVPTNAQREILKNRAYQFDLKNQSLDSLPADFKTANGVAASPDGKTLFVGDIKASTITKFNIEKGKLSSGSKFIDLNFLDKAGPDGMAVSKNGTLFIALFRGGKLLVVNKEGDPIGYLPTGPKSTNCVLSRSEDTLYITANGRLLSAKIPNHFLD